jgi:hypothetical protein
MAQTGFEGRTSAVREHHRMLAPTICSGRIPEPCALVITVMKRQSRSSIRQYISDAVHHQLQFLVGLA